MLSHQSHIDLLSTWIKYHTKLCRSCQAGCCTLPVEVQLTDLVRMGLMDAFELEEDPKFIARRLKKKGVIEHYSQKTGQFTLTRMANGDCLYLDTVTRRCTIYQQRPDTCRNHPRIGPRAGYCAYSPKDRKKPGNLTLPAPDHRSYMTGPEHIPGQKTVASRRENP